MHYTGQSVKRFEDLHLVTGKGSFVDDIQLPDMLYAAEGQPLTGSLMDYAIPRAGALPQVSLETMETPSPTNPLGVKGIGELPTVATPVAVANAIMDALSSVGVRHIDTPLARLCRRRASSPFTPEKIWRALHGAGGGRRDAATAARG